MAVLVLVLEEDAVTAMRAMHIPTFSPAPFCTIYSGTLRQVRAQWKACTHSAARTTSSDGRASGGNTPHCRRGRWPRP